jgi:hypothetical protein
MRNIREKKKRREPIYPKKIPKKQICTKCKHEYTSDYFPIESALDKKIGSVCKWCSRIEYMKYFNNHREEVNKARVERHHAHREEDIQYRYYYRNKMEKLLSIKQDRFRKSKERRGEKDKSVALFRPNTIGNQTYTNSEGHIGSMGTPTKRMTSRAK